MTLISTIIDTAFRETNITAIGTSPTVTQQTEALDLLDNYVKSLTGYELGDPTLELPVGYNNVSTPGDVPLEFGDLQTNYLPKNVRLLLNLTSPQVLNLPPAPEDGARVDVVDVSGNLSTNTLTLQGNGRKIEGATSVLLNTNGATRSYFYRGDQANWVRLDNLTLASESPFPEMFDELLAAALSLRLAPRYGRPLSSESQMNYLRLLSRFKSKYSQDTFVGVESGLLRTSTYRRHGYDNTTNDFNLGRSR